MGLRVKIETACEIVVACVVLHNNCIKNGDNNPPDDLPITHGRQIYEEVSTPDHIQLLDLQATATAVRTALINNYFAHQNYFKPMVVGSIGPYGAHLLDGSEYNGTYTDHMSVEELMAWHRPQAEALLRAGADMLAFETVPALKESEAIARLLHELPDCKAWVSFSCMDGKHVYHGEELSVACAPLLACPPCVAVGVNCTSSWHVESLLDSLVTSGVTRQKTVVVYPNKGDIWSEDKKWTADPRLASLPSLDTLVKRWVSLGASWVGGCCCMGPDKIAVIRKAIDEIQLSL